MSNDNIDNISQGDEGNEPLVRGELLLSRLVDGEASEKDWDEFRNIAGRGAGGLWRALAEAQRDQAVLSAAVGESVRSAERVWLPGGRRSSGGGVIARIAPLAGWAAAACVAVIWGVGLMAPRPGQNNAGAPPQPANIRLASSEDAYGEYLRKGKQEGRVIGEVPDRVVLSTSARPDGRGYDAIILVQVIEKRTVTEVYKTGYRENGEQVLIPTSMTTTNNAPAGRGD